MAWESRNGTGCYYTRSVKRDGRVFREYVGTGPVAEAVARIDEIERDQRRLEREAWRRERERCEKLERGIVARCDQTDEIVRAVLIAHGYHQHHRGEWRKCREPKKINEAKKTK